MKSPEIPDNVDDESYIRGLLDMAEYMQRVSFQSQQIYEEMLMGEEDTVDNPCPNCGEEMIYDGTTGLQCPECDL